jgi:four helix bundle protein
MEKKEFVMSKQLLRSGTAVGALVRETEMAESKKDFRRSLHHYGEIGGGD